MYQNNYFQYFCAALLKLLPGHECAHAGMVYCMDYLRANLDWLLERLRPFIKGARQHIPIHHFRQKSLIVKQA